MSRILIIDDEKMVADITGRILELEGHEVIEAFDGKTGIELFNQEPTDLVITDINMSELDGFEIIDELRKKSAEVRIIVMTGGGTFTKEETLEICRKFDVEGYLAKPFDASELLQTVQECLESLSGQIGGLYSSKRLV
jgi:two-component system, response regulator, stage 0 sporulation protein F